MYIDKTYVVFYLDKDGIGYNGIPWVEFMHSVADAKERQKVLIADGYKDVRVFIKEIKYILVE